MTSKAERRRRKQAAAVGGMFALASVPRRERSGRISRVGVQRDAAGEALEVRCKQMGRAVNAANIRDMRAPWWGCNAGRAMAQEITSDAERAELWDAICHMRRVVTVYDAVIGAPHRHATCLRLLAPSSGLGADASTPALDERSPEQRQRDAVSGLMRLEGWLGHCDKRAMGEAKRAVWDDAAVSDPAALVAALRCVADGLMGRRVGRRAA